MNPSGSSMTPRAAVGEDSHDHARTRHTWPSAALASATKHASWHRRLTLEAVERHERLKFFHNKTARCHEK